MSTGEVRVRPAEPRDGGAIADTVRRAFAREEKAQLVRRLADSGDAVVSLVADAGGGGVVGHAMLCRVTAEIDGRPVKALALAPVSVRPTHHRRGIGSYLVAASLEWARDDGAEAVIVVGDAPFYARFGFCAARAGVFEATPCGEALQAIEIVPGALSGHSGTVAYPSPFNAAEPAADGAP